MPGSHVALEHRSTNDLLARCALFLGQCVDASASYLSVLRLGAVARWDRSGAASCRVRTRRLFQVGIESDTIETWTRP